jgi:endonuclease III
MNPSKTGKMKREKRPVFFFTKPLNESGGFHAAALRAAAAFAGLVRYECAHPALAGQHSPYRVWVSEIMLQQTRVETVIPYFERFVGELPDIFALAGTPDERLYKLWEGLGYYTGARNMKKAAETVVREYGGRFPASFAALRELSGWGTIRPAPWRPLRLGYRVPAVDGNVLRVLSRLTAYDGDVTQSRAKRELTELTASVLPESRVGDFNQRSWSLVRSSACPRRVRTARSVRPPVCARGFAQAVRRRCPCVRRGLRGACRRFRSCFWKASGGWLFKNVLTKACWPAFGNSRTCRVKLRASR